VLCALGVPVAYALGLGALLGALWRPPSECHPKAPKSAARDPSRLAGGKEHGGAP